MVAATPTSTVAAALPAAAHKHLSFTAAPARRSKAASLRWATTAAALLDSSRPTLTTSTFPLPRFAANEPRKGADVLVEALERAGVTDVFAYPGGASMEIHQALTRSKTIRNVLCRHEQAEIFAAEGYARVSGRPGVCISTSGPGATNLISGLADALLDSVPLVAITGQVPRRMIGTDAFQETPIVEVTRSITKHNYLVLHVDDVPRVMKEAFFLASSGRPGPVLVDIPKDIQQQLVVPDWNLPMKLNGYQSRLPRRPESHHLEMIIRLLFESKQPVLYVGGGCLNASRELRRFVELTGIPVASTLMGLGAFPTADHLSLQMLGMHGTFYANYAIDGADLLLAFGVRFNHRVTGKVEIGKNKLPHVSVFADLKIGLQSINSMLEKQMGARKLDSSAWRGELEEQKRKFPLSYKTFGDAIKVLDELTNGEAIITTGVGNDGDGSFLMKIQELGTVRAENLPVKMMVLNIQVLGMVV